MDMFTEIIISWAPMVILIIVWIFFMTKMKKPQNQTNLYMERQNELMEQYILQTERIAVALEKISENK